MAITGTGTDLDPYVPETCADLLTCFQDGSYTGYIELQHDFNFATDADYRDGFTTAIQLNGGKTIRSQEGHMYRINGLRSTNTILLLGMSSFTYTFERVFLSNIVHIISSAGQVFYLNNANGVLNFNSCKISILQKTTFAIGGCLDSQSYVNYTDTSVYVQFSMPEVYTTSQTTKCFSQATKNKSCFEVHNWKFLGDGSSFNILNSTYTTYYGDCVLKATGTSIQKCRINGCSSIVMAMSMSLVESLLGYDGFVYGTMSGVSIFDKDILPAGFTLTANNNVAYCTTAQMKNEQYLLSIGFLP